MSAVASRSEHTWQGLLMRLPGSAALVVGTDLRIHHAEGPLLDDAGLDSSCLAGRTLREALGDAQADDVEPWVRHAAHSGGLTCEHRVGRLWVQARMAPLPDERGRVDAVLTSWHDISERKQAEERLRRTGDTFFALVRNAPFGIYVVDSRLRLAHVSAGAQPVFANVRPLIGRDFAEVLRAIWPQPFADEALAKFRHTLATGERFESLGFSERRRDTADLESYDWMLERVPMADGDHGVACYFYDATQRQRAAEQLRASEQRLQLALDVAALGTWEWDIGRDRIEGNARTCELLELPAPAALSFAQLEARLHPDDVAFNRVLTRRALDGGVDYANEFRVRHGDGRWRWLVSRGRVQRDPQGTPLRLIGNVADVTEQREREQLARHEAERDAYRIALEDALRPLADPRAIMAAACRVLAAALDADRVFYGEFDDGGEFVDVVAEVAPELGAMAGRWSVQRFPTLLAALRGGQRIVLTDLHDTRASLLPERECAALRTVGAGSLVAVPLHKGQQCVAMVCAQRSQPHAWGESELWRIDTTAERTWASVVRARSELALQRSQQRFASLVSIVTDVPWTADARGAFVTAQPAWQVYTGQAWEAHAGFGWLQAVHPQDREALHNAWSDAAERAEPFETEARMWHADSSSWRTCRTRATPLTARDGRVREWVGSCDDVHDERSAAAQLREADRRKDEFLATLSHELRNPLAPVRTAVRLLSQPGADAAQCERARAIIDRQTRHMSLLLDDLLDVARITQGKLALKKQRVELGPVVDAAVEAAQPLITERRHALHVQLPEVPVWLDADPVRLAQVLDNLLTNAARYTAPGGRIDIEAHAADGELRIAVTDTGRGLSADALETIFKMFVQAGRDDGQHPGGLGIGLAIVKGLLDLHGGRVAATSDGPGQGARFAVTLPLPATDAAMRDADAPDAEPHEQARPGTGQRVLVVDDNRDAAEMLAAYLRLNGYEVDVADDGPSGLSQAQRLQLDVALLDIGMPGMDGYALAQRLRASERGRAMRLAALTGWGQSTDQQRAYAAGFDMHFTKPVNLDALCAWMAGACRAASDRADAAGDRQHDAGDVAGAHRRGQEDVGR